MGNRVVVLDMSAMLSGALIKLMDHKDAVGNVFNIGSNEEISILQLAQRMKELTQSESEIVFVPYDEAYEEGFEDMPRRIPDITKVRDLVGFRAEDEIGRNSGERD